ncbi:MULTISPECIES: effector-associated domain EAD1-containing protein [Nonomuraea]|uniref:Effector-associated domain EAD1-containing protein n=1 Tax=Nonomuraea mangrovi TaxID=2316207 RepID=A0ABW4SLV1_9ACTN
MRNELVSLLAGLFDDEARARDLLTVIQYPRAHTPQFTTPMAFWQQVISRIEQGVMTGDDGITALLGAAGDEFPSNKGLQALREKDEAVREPPAQKSPKPLQADGPCSTLLLIGIDKPEEPDDFVELVRREVDPDAELLYVARERCAVGVSDPGTGRAEVVNRLQQLVTASQPGREVVYEHYSFKPYLYRFLLVVGPDGTPYQMTGVPATTLPEDIAQAVIQQSPAMTDRRGGVVRTVIDHESAQGGGRQRLVDPQLSLHEVGVKDEDTLHVGAEATAGAVNPVMRMRAQMRARAQIRRFEQTGHDFRITRYDNEDLPNRFHISFDAPGFAPPDDIDSFFHPDLPLPEWPFDDLDPVPVTRHELAIFLPPMFPVSAPLVIWETDVFHPNIWRKPAPSQNARHNQVCLGALMNGYRPDLDFGSLCQLLVDIGSYQNYDVVDADTWPDPVAAFWAKSPNGQAAITAIGGRLIEERDPAPRGEGRAPLLWISPLEDPDGR